MKHSINVAWQKGMAFKSEINGHEIVIDAPEEVGGKDSGPRPKQLMLLALAGCTGMDVASLLKKMRVEVDDINLRVEAEMTEDHPKHYSEMKIIYEFKGKDLDLDKIKKAVDLSQENYCGVSHMYRKAMKLSYEIKILD